MTNEDQTPGNPGASILTCTCGCRDMVAGFLQSEVTRFMDGGDDEPFILIAAYLRGLQAAVDILHGQRHPGMAQEDHGLGRSSADGLATT